jgi:hypothetical protein
LGDVPGGSLPIFGEDLVADWAVAAQQAAVRPVVAAVEPVTAFQTDHGISEGGDYRTVGMLAVQADEALVAFGFGDDFRTDFKYSGSGHLSWPPVQKMFLGYLYQNNHAFLVAIIIYRGKDRRANS